MVCPRSVVAAASIFFGVFGTVSCGGSTPEPNDVPVTPRASAPPRGSVSRQAVVEAVDAGLGAFLQRIQVEPVTRDGAYLGFQLKAMDPAGGWAAYDIQLGDIVTHANGKSLEAEATAFEVFQELRQANEIKLSVIRDGVSRQVIIPIVGQVKSAPAPTAATAPEATSTATLSSTSG
jgi:type II secretory pathway component PulC